MAKPTTGRASMFRGKAGGVRVQGILTREGGKCLRDRRSDLARLYRTVTGRAPASISDADVIEYLARGHDETAEYFEQGG